MRRSIVLPVLVPVLVLVASCQSEPETTLAVHDLAVPAPPAPPPGCDCFGCCTLCDPASGACYDIAIDPSTSPSCTTATLADPTICVRCTRMAICGTPCGGGTCILCPGQDVNDLPPSCNGATQCPSGVQSCSGGQACPAQTYCSSSMCCVGVIQ